MFQNDRFKKVYQAVNRLSNTDSIHNNYSMGTLYMSGGAVRSTHLSY